MKMKNDLTYLSIMMLILVVFTTFAEAVGQKNVNDDDYFDNNQTGPLTPSSEKINLNGTWSYKTSNGMTGTIEIIQEGKDIALRITSGATCRPVAVCSYTGTEDGNVVEVSNSVTVDKEGGIVTSAMQLIFSSNEHATGSSTNHYVHPEGYEKRWNLESTLWRKVKKDNSKI